MAAAITDSSSKDEQDCPICLDVFTSPRQLPCLHTFCEHCLQDYITKRTRTTVQASEDFLCPVCRALTRPAHKEKPVREWASLFPHSPFPLVGKSKVDRPCQVCLNKSEVSTNLAKTFCVVCEEFMCDNCAAYHQSMKMSRSHKIITVEDWDSNPENRIKFTEGFGCPEHDNEDIKFYCRNHEAAFCGTCLYHHQKVCKDVLELKQSLPGLMKEMNPLKIMEQMRKLEDHLKHFMETNEENINILESHVHIISAEIKAIRKKLNAVLDDIEKMVKLEGNRIYKEWLIRKQEQNHQCQSLVSAMRNSQALLKMVSQYGSDTQKFLVSSKTMKQLNCYTDQIREKFERMDNIRIRLELDRNMKATLSQDAKSLVKIICQEESKELHSPSFIFPFQRRTVELSKVIDVRCPSGLNPDYLGMVQLPEGYIALADSTNKTCCLYDSSYNLITSYTLLESPCNMCLIDDNEVAVTLNGLRTIQFLSIRDRSIRVTGAIENRNECYGIDAVSSKEIVVSGPCDINKCYWSVITRNGNVKLHHEFDSQKTFRANVALDKSKSRVYISVSGGNAVYCFGVKDGKLYFVYMSKDLKFPMGISVDREDNVYVVGYMSNNIHKLSPGGVAIQVITSGVPAKPQGISFDQRRDQFVITNGCEMRKKLHYFVHK